MEHLARTLTDVVRGAFPGAEFRVDPYPGFGKLHGSIVWEGFGGLSQLDRQHQVWDVLRPALTDEQRFATGFLLTVTPAEINAMQEVAA